MQCVLKWQLERCQSGQEDAKEMRQSEIELRGSEEWLKTTIFLTSESLQRVKTTQGWWIRLQYKVRQIGFLIR